MSIEETASPKFVHQHLDLQRDIIRVVSVQPGEPCTAISCVVRHVPLRSTHVCLSYMWGDSNDDRDIYVNQRRFTVSKNLWTFLRRGRTRLSKEELWIDAICIDQENLRERNHEVQRMARIYGQARQVLVWLGDIDAPSDSVNLEDKQSYTENPKLRLHTGPPCIYHGWRH